MYTAISILLLIILLVVWLTWLGHRHQGADWGHPLTNIVDGLIRVLCKKYHRLGEVRLPVPADKKVIIVANHLSGLDPFILISACDRPIRFMIAKEEYEKPVLNWLFRAAKCIPVDRSGRVEKAFRSALRAINNGELVGLFPQGGIHLADSDQQHIKPGLVRLCQLSGASVFAARMWGIRSVGSVIGSVIKRGDVKLESRPLITNEQVSHPEFKKELADWFLFRDRDDGHPHAGREQECGSGEPYS